MSKHLGNTALPLTQWKNNTKRLASVGIMGTGLRASLKPSGYHSIIVLRCLKEALHWVPIMPRDARLSDSGCIFFQSGLFVILYNKQYTTNKVFSRPFQIDSVHTKWGEFTQNFPQIPYKTPQIPPKTPPNPPQILTQIPLQTSPKLPSNPSQNSPKLPKSPPKLPKFP